MDTEISKEIEGMADRLTDMILIDEVNEQQAQEIMSIIDLMCELTRKE